ncbi:MAG: phosphoribosylamine--glycine ligase [Nitrospirota bacterium]
MNILVVGGGGREHALAWKIAQSPQVAKLYCAPGNPGIAGVAECLPIPSDDIAGLRDAVKAHRVDLTVVGPEAPLAAGIVDEFRKDKLLIFGPHKAAARIEASKAFSKDLMVRLRIPTAEAQTFTALAPALEYLDRRDAPIVVKADGLAQGKGVVVAASRAEAREAVRAMLEGKAFGEAGARVVIEEFLDGEELTVMAFTDGKTVVPLAPAQDHKRVGDGDTGLNTGGMGAYAPAPVGTRELLDRVRRTVLEPVVEGLSRAGSPFHGVLYAGLMMVRGEPKVLEFNARMGDPETQVVLPLLKTDVVDVLLAVAEHRLDRLTVEWHDRAAVCVVLAASGYPGTPVKGTPIAGLEELARQDELVVFHAGTAAGPGGIVTAGGRVLGVTGIGETLEAARDRAYAGVRRISFDGMHYRSDIAARALNRR